MKKKRKDVLTPSQRSYCMSQVKSKDTKIEIFVRSILFRKGYRFRKHVKSLSGSPDIVFSSRRVAVFIDGDFWHGRNYKDWKHKLKPEWQKKISNNILRDKRNYRRLKKQGWRIIRIWERDTYANTEKQIQRIVTVLETKIS